MNTYGEGKYAVWLKKELVGEDIVYMLGGGERAHVGSVVVKEPGKKTKVVKLGGHYDHIVLEPIAVAACEKYGCTVVAVGGVHVDKATKKEIDILVNNCKELVRCI
jgi:hypothetical protein